MLWCFSRDIISIEQHHSAAGRILQEAIMRDLRCYRTGQRTAQRNYTIFTKAFSQAIECGSNVPPTLDCATRHCGVKPFAILPHLEVARLEHAAVLRRGRKRVGRRVWEPHLPTLSSYTRVQFTMGLLHWVMLALNVPGDVVETGTYTGGTVIAMLHMLDAMRDEGSDDGEGGMRRLWTADSFDGLPGPSDPDRSDANCFRNRPNKNHVACQRFPREASRRDRQRANEAALWSNLAKFNVSAERLQVLRGWFHKTLPTAPIRKIAFLRLDGDLYNSTMEALVHLYPKLSRGGVIMVDDVGVYPGSWAAIAEYRKRHKIGATLRYVYEERTTFTKYEAVWWRKISR